MRLAAKSLLLATMVAALITGSLSAVATHIYGPIKKGLPNDAIVNFMGKALTFTSTEIRDNFLATLKAAKRGTTRHAMGAPPNPNNDWCTTAEGGVFNLGPKTECTVTVANGGVDGVGTHTLTLKIGDPAVQFNVQPVKQVFSDISAFIDNGGTELSVAPASLKAAGQFAKLTGFTGQDIKLALSSESPGEFQAANPASIYPSVVAGVGGGFQAAPHALDAGPNSAFYAICTVSSNMQLHIWKVANAANVYVSTVQVPDGMSGTARSIIVVVASIVSAVVLAMAGSYVHFWIDPIGYSEGKRASSIPEGFKSLLCSGALDEEELYAQEELTEAEQMTVIDPATGRAVRIRRNVSSVTDDESATPGGETTDAMSASLLVATVLGSMLLL